PPSARRAAKSRRPARRRINSACHSGTPRSGGPGTHEHRRGAISRGVFIDSGLAPSGRPGKVAALPDSPLEIGPIRIRLLDQSDLPVTPPFLQLFLALDR